MVVTDVSPDGKLLSYDMTWTKSSDKTGSPTVSTLLLGESILSPKINSFGYISENPQFYQPYSSPAKWAYRKTELKKFSDEISSKGYSQAVKHCPGLLNDPVVEAWKKARKWDQNLAEWSKVVQSLMEKYATRK